MEFYCFMPKLISKNKPPRVVVAMSGGVDSSVAAYLLKKQGYDVIGIFFKLWVPSHYDPCDTKKQNLCCDDKALSIARQTADKLKISFYVLRVDKFFKKEIVDNFVSEYEQGRTPNPCVRCNRYIKFGYLWKKARQLKADFLATGHYIKKIPNNKLQITNKSQIRNNKKIRNKSLENCDFSLMRSKDEKKDQTYFLSSIDPKIIPHLLFPLGNMTKKEVRAIAKKAKMSVYNKKDSMGICFIPDGDTDSFLKQHSKKLQKPGEIMNKYGNVLGKHEGLLGYTIGQKIGDDKIAKNYLTQEALCFLPSPSIRRGTSDEQSEKVRLGVPRLYVVSIDSKKNRLIIGENEDCFSDAVTIENFNVVNDRFWKLVKGGKTLYAQIRGGHKAEQCRISLIRTEPNEAKSYKLKAKFLKPVRAITPGQTMALYEKNVLVGGGIIK